MAESISEHVLIEKSKKQGGLTVNRKLQNDLANILSKDASLDLTAWLKLKGESYSKDRNKAIDYSYRKAAAQDLGIGDASKPSRPAIFIKGNYPTCNLEVIRPLDTSVIGWAISMGQPSFPHCCTNTELDGLVARCAVIASQPSSTVLRIAPSIVLKISTPPSIRYLKTYEYILEHASNIPISPLLGILTTDRTAYAFMQYVDGVSLDTLWGSLDVAEKRAIQQQLNKIFKVLRAIPRPPRPSNELYLGTGDPPFCIDLRRHSRESIEPIRTEVDFNHFLTKVDHPRSSPLLDMVFLFLREDHEIVMTHGDLHPRNIIVSRNKEDRSIRIEAILDWEVSGWYPAYWEYVKALYTISAAERTLDWYLYLPTDAIGVWGAEYAIDKLIDRFL